MGGLEQPLVGAVLEEVVLQQSSQGILPGTDKGGGHWGHCPPLGFSRGGQKNEKEEKKKGEKERKKEEKRRKKVKKRSEEGEN